MIEEVLLSSIFCEKGHVMWQVTLFFAIIWGIRLERNNRITRKVETSSEGVWEGRSNAFLWVFVISFC